MRWAQIRQLHSQNDDVDDDLHICKDNECLSRKITIFRSVRLSSTLKCLADYYQLIGSDLINRVTWDLFIKVFTIIVIVIVIVIVNV